MKFSDKIKAYGELRTWVYAVLNRYVEDKQIRPDEDFDDFSLMDEKVLLFFNDSGLYTSVKLEKLDKYVETNNIK